MGLACDYYLAGPRFGCGKGGFSASMSRSATGIVLILRHRLLFLCEKWQNYTALGMPRI